MTTVSEVIGVPEPPFPLILKWNPKPDITVHELALSLPYIIDKYQWIFEGDIDTTLSHFRHFEINNPNQTEL